MEKNKGRLERQVPRENRFSKWLLNMKSLVMAEIFIGKKRPQDKDKSLCFYLLFTHCSSGVSLIEALESTDREMKGRFNLLDIRSLFKKGRPVALCMQEFFLRI